MNCDLPGPFIPWLGNKADTSYWPEHDIAIRGVKD
jgi:hypothetical protein